MNTNTSFQGYKLIKTNSSEVRKKFIMCAKKKQYHVTQYIFGSSFDNRDKKGLYNFLILTGKEQKMYKSIRKSWERTKYILSLAKKIHLKNQLHYGINSGIDKFNLFIFG